MPTWKQTVAPSEEPLTRDEVKEQLRLDTTLAGLAIEPSIGPQAVTGAIAITGDAVSIAAAYAATLLAEVNSPGGATSGSFQLQDSPDGLAWSDWQAPLAVAANATKAASQNTYTGSQPYLRCLASGTATAGASVAAAVAVQPKATDEDRVFDRLIAAARQYVETRLQRQLVTATWELRLAQFAMRECVPTDAHRVMQPYEDLVLELRRLPVQSLGTVTYVDTAGATQTLAGSDYQVDLRSAPVRMWPAYGKCWPGTRYQLGAVTVHFVAGYGDAGDVPDGIKDYMLQRIAWLWAHRGTDDRARMPEYIEGLLDMFDWGSR